MSMLEAAPAKINLFLHVTGRRADGYHLLDSLAVFGPAMDRLYADPGPALSLAVRGPFAEGLSAVPDNLVLRAAQALGGQGAALRLEKNLPVASGIGGGSADAAAALRLLNRFHGLGLSPAALRELALPLGADVPVCVESRPMRMQGVGEMMLPAPRLPPDVALLLVNPRLPLATPAVFRARQPGFSPPAALPEAWHDAAHMAADLARCGNDLQAAAIGLCPPVAQVLAAIAAQPECLLARMSGSGGTCFGIFKASAAAHRAAQAMPRSWWSAAGPLAEPPV
jgi:4-diphosphocytidyl-2-C-methyl-D-erythritol kinase